MFQVNKQKWVPLEIDITKSRSRKDRSPKHLSQREKNRGGYFFLLTKKDI